MVTRAKIPDWLAQLYPFAPQAFRTPSGARMSCVDEGPRDDEAVLMLHGNPTWSFFYREVVRALSPTVRCVAPDHIGMGLSEKPPHYDYTLPTRIVDIEALAASLGLKRVHLIVHDWGGAIGFGFAARQPDIVGRLVVLNTAAFSAPWIPRRIACCRLPAIGPLLVRGLNGFAGPATWMAMHRRKLSAAEKRAYLFPYRSWADRVGVNAFVRDIPVRKSHSSWSALKTVEAGLSQFRDRPAMIVWGGRDFCFDDRYLARWREILPRADVRRIPDAGHYVLEDAGDETVPVIAKFLTRS